MTNPGPKILKQAGNRYSLRLYNAARALFFSSKGSGTPIWHQVDAIMDQRIGRFRDTGPLEYNMKILLGVDKPGSEFTGHHIVTKIYDRPPSMRADSLRANDVLARLGIDVNDGANGIYLPNHLASTDDVRLYGPRHSPLGSSNDPNIHNAQYLRAVADELEAAEPGGVQEVRNKLQEIGKRIVERDFPGIPAAP